MERSREPGLDTSRGYLWTRILWNPLTILGLAFLAALKLALFTELQTDFTYTPGALIVNLFDTHSWTSLAVMGVLDIAIYFVVIAFLFLKLSKHWRERHGEVRSGVPERDPRKSKQT
jgi:hypothetical protein